MQGVAAFCVRCDTDRLDIICFLGQGDIIHFGIIICYLCVMAGVLHEAYYNLFLRLMTVVVAAPALRRLHFNLTQHMYTSMHITFSLSLSLDTLSHCMWRIKRPQIPRKHTSSPHGAIRYTTVAFYPRACICAINISANARSRTPYMYITPHFNGNPPAD